MRIFLLAVFAIIMGGCSTLPDFKGYEGPERPRSDLAKITTDSEKAHSIYVNFDKRLYISKVDGVSSAADFFSTSRFQYPDVAYVLPGTRKIEVFWTFRNSVSRATLTVEVEAGRDYIVRHQLVGDSIVRFRLEDINTEKPR
jgi:hypothetical protein